MPSERDADEAVLQARARASVELEEAAVAWVKAMTVHPVEWARANEVRMIRAVRCLCPDLLGAFTAYGLCLLLWLSMQQDERWWQENENRRNSRWPVLGPIGEEPNELRSIDIRLPNWMLDDLRQIAEARGVTVTEHLRRCVSLDRSLFADPEAVVTVRDSDGHERTVRLEATEEAGDG